MPLRFDGSVSALMGIVLFCCAAAPVSAQSRGEPQWVIEPVSAPGVQYGTFEGPAAGGPVSYHVYLPDAYQADEEARFPALYWLHGSGGLNAAAIRQVSGHFAGAMRAGEIPPMIVVMPNAPPLSLWVDSKDGATPVENVVIEELLPHIDATYRTIASREGRIVDGFSMGGYGAARFGFKRHDLFGAASSLAGGPLQQKFTHAPRASERGRRAVLQRVFGGDHDHFRALSPWALAEQNADAIAEHLLLRVVIGEQDEMIDVAHEFTAHLQRLDIPHEFTVIPGVGHEPMGVMRGLGADGWEFYRRALAPLRAMPAN